MRIRHLLTATALAAAALLPTADPAAASCMFDDRPIEAKIQESPTVFVGEVLATRHGDTTAEVRLSEIWKGATNLRQVTVRGGTGQDGAATSVDRSFTVGTTYLFLVRPEGGVFTDNSCSATQEWTPELAAARPDGATTVDADQVAGEDADEDGQDGRGGVLPILAALGLLLAAGGALAARGRASKAG